MNTVWALRREEVLSDCIVSPDVFNQMVDRLGEFVVPYVRRDSSLHIAKMFQTCGSATLSESERTINASEGSDDHPSAALPLLPRKRYC